MQTLVSCSILERGDVDNPLHAISESNEHNFGGWRQQQQDFNILQFIGIEDKRWVGTNAVYKRGHTTWSYISRMKGYQSIFSDLVRSSMNCSIKSKTSGRIYDDLEKQLWNEVDGVFGEQYYQSIIYWICFLSTFVLFIYYVESFLTS